MTKGIDVMHKKKTNEREEYAGSNEVVAKLPELDEEVEEQSEPRYKKPKKRRWLGRIAGFCLLTVFGIYIIGFPFMIYWLFLTILLLLKFTSFLVFISGAFALLLASWSLWELVSRILLVRKGIYVHARAEATQEIKRDRRRRAQLQPCHVSFPLTWGSPTTITLEAVPGSMVKVLYDPRHPTRIIRKFGFSELFGYPIVGLWIAVLILLALIF